MEEEGLVVGGEAAGGCGSPIVARGEDRVDGVRAEAPVPLPFRVHENAAARKDNLGPWKVPGAESGAPGDGETFLGRRECRQDCRRVLALRRSAEHQQWLGATPPDTVSSFLLLSN